MQPKPLSSQVDDQSTKKANWVLREKVRASKRVLVTVVVLVVVLTAMRTYQVISSERAYHESMVQYQFEITAHNQEHGWKKEFIKLYRDSLYLLVSIKTEPYSGETYEDVFKRYDLLTEGLRRLENRTRSLDFKESNAGSKAKFTMLDAINSAIEVSESMKSYWQNQMFIEGRERTIKRNNAYSDEPFYGSIYRESERLESEMRTYTRKSYELLGSEQKAEERLKEKRIEIETIIRLQKLPPCKPVRYQSQKIVQAFRDVLSSTKPLESDASTLTDMLLGTKKAQSKFFDLIKQSQTFSVQVDGLLKRSYNFEGEARDRLLVFLGSLKRYLEAVAECAKAKEKLMDNLVMFLSRSKKSELAEWEKKSRQQEVVFEELKIDVLERYERFAEAKQAVELVVKDVG